MLKTFQLGGKSITQKYRINDKIRSPQVRLIDGDGQNMGIIPIEEARKLAAEVELDLVEVSPEATPPVCRILDYGKLKYQQKKKLQQKKKPKTHQKEIRIRPRISEHDIQVKLKLAKKFIAHGDRVLITMNFRGREMVHMGLGRDLMTRLISELVETAKIEKYPKLEGRRMTMVIVPK